MKTTAEPSFTAFQPELRCILCDKKSCKSSDEAKCEYKPWHDQYRIVDLSLTFDSEIKSLLKRSVENYSFDSDKGILQYAGLPVPTLNHSNPLKTGLTPLLHLPALSNYYGARVYMKSEGHNPSGCFKDRETLLCLLNAKKNGLSKAVIYSSGNAAASAAIFAQKNKMHLIAVVAGDTYNEKIEFIKAHAADVIIVGDDNTVFEDGYRLFAACNAQQVFSDQQYDNWSVNNPYRVEGDKTTALEIVKQLNETKVPDYVVVPTANGSCLAGVWKGFKELFEIGYIDKLPKMISAGITNASPVNKAVQSKVIDEPVACDLSRVKKEDASIGSIILAEEGYDSIAAAQAVVESGGTSVEVGRKDIEKIYHQFLDLETQLAQNNNVLPEPASLISIAGIAKLRDKMSLTAHHTVVSVVTGSGFKARKKIKEIMADQPENLPMVDSILDRKIQQLYPEASEKGREIRVAASREELVQAFEKLKK